MKRARTFGATLTALALAACAGLWLGPVGGFETSAQGATELPTLELTPHVSGLTQPVVVTHAGDGSNRLFVVEQAGRIRIVKAGALLAAPFLDIGARISTGGERGLLGLAFPPGYADTGRFYVYYTNPSGNIVIARYRRSATDADRADPASEQVVITIDHPTFSNHNGGQLAFGPDGYLYAGIGDGGGGGDPNNNAQNPAQLLGKLIRINTEIGNPATYTVPATNPFAASTTHRPEIWALGLRNPWRFSFDRQAHDLYLADVGQGNWEEIDFQPAASTGGENYGWRVMEGTHCYPPSTTSCSTAGLTPPVWEYDHSAGDCSVTGGYVYRGSASPRMQGLYIYGDFCTGRIWGLRREGGVWKNYHLISAPFRISTFGENEAGRLFVAAYNTGTIYEVGDGGDVQFSSSAFTVNEGSGTATITVTRINGSTGAASVNYATADGTATAGSDYAPASGTLTWADGDDAPKTFNVTITNDSIFENDETVNLTLSGVTGSAALGRTTTATLTVTNDDPAPTPTPAPAPTPTPVPTPTPAPAPGAFRLGAESYDTSEVCGGVSVTVERTGDVSATAAVDYEVRDVSARERSDYTAAFGTLRFTAGETSKTFSVLVTEDSHAEALETAQVVLANPSGGTTTLGSPSTATIRIADDPAEPNANANDDAANFVCQHYHDFLSRQADDAGQGFWAGELNACGGDAACLDDRRQNVSAAFFLSVEFQQTGYEVIRAYKATFNETPQRPRGLPRYREFLRDTQDVGRGVVVGQPGWEQRLETNRREFARRWVQSSEFVAQFPAGMAAEPFVDKLFQNSGVTPEQAERAAAVAAFGAGGAEGRAAALLAVTRSKSVFNRQYNPAFVLMQYFGYLRRNPDDAPDSSFAGYDFWLAKLDSFSRHGEDLSDERVALGRVKRAQMVRSFLVSAEYRERFGRP